MRYEITDDEWTGYDADWIRAPCPPAWSLGEYPTEKKSGRGAVLQPVSLYLYRARNLVERFFNKIKHCRRVATRHDKLAANYLAIRPTCVNPALAAH